MGPGSRDDAYLIIEVRRRGSGSRSLLAMNDSGRSDPIADMINLMAAPLAGGIRSVEQFRRGSDEMLRAIENLNVTLENLNEAATRVNRLVSDIEGPIRAMLPQLTRSVETADELSRLLEAPVRAAAPNLERIVEALSSPGFTTLPSQLSEFMGTIGELSKRLGPLAALAENAGGLFGGFRMPGTPSPRSAPRTPAERRESAARAAEESSPEPTVTTLPADKATATKTTAKKAAATKSAAKKSSAKKSAAKKSAAKKSTANTTTANKASTKKASGS